MSFKTIEEAVKAYDDLDKKYKDLESLKGKLGRRVGDLETKVKTMNAPVNESSNDDEMSEEQVEVEVQKFTKNPRKYMRNIHNELIKTIREEVDSVRNSVGYLNLIREYPEFSDKETQNKVIELQQNARDSGKMLSTVDVLENMRIEKKRGELTAQEAKIKEAQGSTDQTKEGLFSSQPGVGTAETVATQNQPKKELTEAEKVLASFDKKIVSKDTAPF